MGLANYYFLGVNRTLKTMDWTAIVHKNLLQQFKMAEAKSVRTQQDPSMELLWKAVKHIFRYLVGTDNYGLHTRISQAALDTRMQIGAMNLTITGVCIQVEYWPNKLEEPKAMMCCLIDC